MVLRRGHDRREERQGARPHVFMEGGEAGPRPREVYLRKLERPWDPLYYVKKAVRKKPKRITLVDDLIQPITRKDEAPTSPSKILDDGEDPTSPVARAKLKRRISDQIEIVKRQAELEVRQERAERRKKLEELRGAVDLYDVTFGGATLGLSLVLATDHRTKRKMIIVDTIRERRPLRISCSRRTSSSPSARTSICQTTS